MMTRNAAESAAANLRMATMQLTGMRVPPRVRTIPSVRRKVPVTIITEPPEVVIVRHSVRNLDSPVHKSRPVHDQRA